jgi:hypothetical protein
VHSAMYILVITFASPDIWINSYLYVTFAMPFDLVLIINYMKYILQIHCLLGTSTKVISFPRAGISRVFNMKLNAVTSQTKWQTGWCHMNLAVDTKCFYHKYHLFCCSFKVLKSIISVLLRWVNQLQTSLLLCYFLMVQLFKTFNVQIALCQTVTT